MKVKQLKGEVHEVWAKLCVFAIFSWVGPPGRNKLESISAQQCREHITHRPVSATHARPAQFLIPFSSSLPPFPRAFSIIITLQIYPFPSEYYKHLLAPEIQRVLSRHSINTRDILSVGRQVYWVIKISGSMISFSWLWFVFSKLTDRRNALFAWRRLVLLNNGRQMWAWFLCCSKFNLNIAWNSSSYNHIVVPYSVLS